MKLTALAVLLSLAAPSAAGASPALLVPMPPRVTFVRGPVPHDPEQGLTVAASDGATGTIFYSQALSRFARAHEIGHLLDAEVFTDGDRRFFGRLMQVPGPGPWVRGAALTAGGLASPNEWFADYYAADATALDVKAGENVSSYAVIGPRRLSRFSRALARFGRRYSLQPYT